MLNNQLLGYNKLDNCKLYHKIYLNRHYLICVNQMNVVENNIHTEYMINKSTLFRTIYNDPPEEELQELTGILGNQSKKYELEDKIYLDATENTLLKIEITDSPYVFSYENNQLVKTSYYYKDLKRLGLAPRDLDSDSLIGVIDIETYKDLNNYAQPHAIGILAANTVGKFQKEINEISGLNTKLYYLNDYKTPSDMIWTAINELLVNKYHNYTFYAHNLRDFDGILLLKVLVEHKNSDPNITFDTYSDPSGKVISINVTKKLRNKKVVIIKFVDSYKIIPSALNLPAYIQPELW